MAPTMKELSRWLDANSEYCVAPEWADVVKHSVSIIHYNSVCQTNQEVCLVEGRFIRVHQGTSVTLDFHILYLCGGTRGDRRQQSLPTAHFSYTSHSAAESQAARAATLRDNKITGELQAHAKAAYYAASAMNEVIF